MVLTYFGSIQLNSMYSLHLPFTIVCIIKWFVLHMFNINHFLTILLPLITFALTHPYMSVI